MNRIKPWVALAGLAWSIATSAQQTPQVWIAPQARQQPIALDDVAIRVRMHGFMAHTRIEMTFANPNARVLEGEFVFPLGAGQAVTGHALEVDGALREGVVVPKETARVAFEETTRRRIDPGLAELTRGNVFRTRLYPIPANGTKRIALEFEQVMDDAGTHWRYLLPLQFRQPVRRFSVDAEAPLDGKVPEIDGDSPDASLRFEQVASVWRAQFRREHVTPQSELAFRVPKQASDVAQMEAKDTREPMQRAIVARIDSGRPADLAPPPAPRRVALYFDASGSARDRDLRRERDAVAAYLATLGDVGVDLIAFRDVADAPRQFELHKGDATALLAALQSLPLDGASDYGAIDFAAAKGADLAVVIGDGLDTFGSGRVDFGGAPARLAVLHAAQRVDPARLADIARHGGGTVIDLTRRNAKEAAAALAAPSWQLLSIDGAGACADLGMVAPQPVESVLTLSARCTGKSSLRLRFGTPGGTRSVEREVSFGHADAATGALADAVWRRYAQDRIAVLGAASPPDIDAITALATRHGVVTEHTSLLVLDRIEDYVRYGVEPKEAFLRADYARLVARRPKAGADADARTHLQSLAQRWRTFRDWHADRHPWLETQLAPAAATELANWNALMKDARTTVRQAAASASKQADAIAAESRALAARWTTDGADAEKRKTWEREAIALMLRIDALRTLRLQRAPESAAWNDPSAVAGSAGAGGARRESLAEERAASAPIPAPAPPPSTMAAVARAEPGSIAADSHRTMRPEAAKPMAVAAPALEARIALTGWKADTPYLATLRASRDAYATYLTLRTEPDNALAPAFYLDCADWFRDEAKQPTLALRILSNLAEIGDGNAALLRVLGHRLVQWQLEPLAVRPFEDALGMRPEEPQSHRDLALVLSRLPQPQSERAARLLWHVASRTWPRFPDMELIALHELNALAATAGTSIVPADLGVPEVLLEPLPLGLRVVLTWDADNTDIDLWVIDPTGEAVYYAQPKSRSGGIVSRDYTQGYGPEVFTIARPLPGTYRVQAHYFGDRRQSLTGPVTVQVEFQTGFGRSDGQRLATTRRLASGKERIDVGQFRIEP